MPTNDTHHSLSSLRHRPPSGNGLRPVYRANQPNWMCTGLQDLKVRQRRIESTNRRTYVAGQPVTVITILAWIDLTITTHIENTAVQPLPAISLLSSQVQTPIDTVTAAIAIVATTIPRALFSSSQDSCPLRLEDLNPLEPIPSPQRLGRQVGETFVLVVLVSIIAILALLNDTIPTTSTTLLDIFILSPRLPISNNSPGSTTPLPQPGRHVVGRLSFTVSPS